MLARWWPVATVFLLALAARPAAADPRGFDPDAVYRIPVGDGPRRGAETAPITIVEWSDFACKFCNRIRPTLEQLERLYPGKLRWAYRHLPLDDDDTLAAEASLAAAAQGRFWPMHDRLFAVHGQVDRAAVELYAAELGLDLGRFRADLDSGAFRARVAADADTARLLGIAGTPTFFVNGRAVRGAQPLQVFVRVVEEELARVESARKSGGAADYDALVAAGRPTADMPADTAPAVDDLDSQSTYRVGLGLPGHAIGPADALVTVVVWSDFECPYCAQLAPTLVRLRKEYGDRVRLIHRHLPLVGHPHAQLAAEAAVAAAAQGKFWPMCDALFARRGALSRADLEADARAAGLDLAAFRAALDDRRYHDAVAADAASAGTLGITGTPTMFVNGAPVSGAVRWERLQQVVDLQLAAAERLVAAGVERRDVYGLVMVSARTGERGDPSQMPMPASTGVVELGQADRETAVIAACRDREPTRAGSLAGRLTGEHRAAAARTCSAYGIDLR